MAVDSVAVGASEGIGRRPPCGGSHRTDHAAFVKPNLTSLPRWVLPGRRWRVGNERRVRWLGDDPDRCLFSFPCPRRLTWASASHRSAYANNCNCSATQLQLQQPLTLRSLCIVQYRGFLRSSLQIIRRFCLYHPPGFRFAGKLTKPELGPTEPTLRPLRRVEITTAACVPAGSNGPVLLHPR
nr:unnamed protein product [Digitaria exilis]